MSHQNKQSRYNGTVAVWYTAHSQSDPRDWNNIKEFDGPYHPLQGYYQCNKPEVIQKQLREMRRAGIDLIVYDCYATGAFALEDIAKDEALRLLVKELSDQKDETRKLSLCIWLEKYIEIPTLEQYRFALDYVRDHLAGRDFYYRYHDKPLVVTYLNGASTAIDTIEHQNTFFELRRIRPYQSDVWSYIEYYPQMLRKSWMSACPSFDSYLENAYLEKYVHRTENLDLAQVRQKAARAERENGEYFRKQLLWAKQADPEIIFISGWNDWQYGNHIEPAVEYGYQYVDLAAEVLGRWEEAACYR